MAEELHIPPEVRAAALNRIEKAGTDSVSLGEEFLMREGFASFEDMIIDVRRRFGDDEAERVREDMRALAEADARSLTGVDALSAAYRQTWMQRNLPHYALISAPDAIFINGVEYGLELVANRYAEPGTARGSQERDAVAQQIDEMFSRRGIPYQFDGGQLVWAGDRGLHQVVVGPALQALADARLAGALNEFEAALMHLRAGTLKDREDAIEEAAKSVESALKVLIAETGTQVQTNATMQPMFNALKDAGVLPAYVDNMVQAAARIRNARGGHGAGAQARQVELDEATAAVNGAASALVFLAAKLP